MYAHSVGEHFGQASLHFHYESDTRCAKTSKLMNYNALERGKGAMYRLPLIPACHVFTNSMLTTQCKCVYTTI